MGSGRANRRKNTQLPLPKEPWPLASISSVSQINHLQQSYLLEPHLRWKRLVAIIAQGQQELFFTFQINKAVSSVLRNRLQNRLFCKITQLNYFQPAERENPFLATFNFLTLFPLSFPNLHPHIWNVILMCSLLSARKVAGVCQDT